MKKATANLVVDLMRLIRGMTQAMEKWARNSEKDDEGTESQKEEPQ